MVSALRIGFLSLLIACLGLSVTACGDDGDSSDSSGSSGSSGMNFIPSKLDIVQEENTQQQTANDMKVSAPSNSVSKIQDDGDDDNKNKGTKLTIRNSGNDDIKGITIKPDNTAIRITQNKCTNKTLGQSDECIVRFKARTKVSHGHIKVTAEGGLTGFEPYDVVEPSGANVDLPEGPIVLAVGQGSLGQDKSCDQGHLVTVTNKSTVPAKGLSFPITGTQSGDISVRQIQKKSGSKDKGPNSCQNSKGKLILDPGSQCSVCLSAKGPPDHPDVEPSDPSDLPQLQVTGSNVVNDASVGVQLKKPKLKLTIENGGLMTEVATTKKKGDKAIQIENDSLVPAYFKTQTQNLKPDADAGKLEKIKSGKSPSNFGIDKVGTGVDVPDFEKDCRTFTGSSEGDANGLLQPGGKCHLPVKVTSKAFGMARLKMFGNFQKISPTFINIAPTQIQYSQPSSNDEQVNDGTPINYAVVPEAADESAEIEIKNSGPFELRGANFKVFPDVDDPNVNNGFSVEVLGNKNGDKPSCTRLAAGDTCQIKIHRASANKGQQGAVRLTARNILNGRSRLPIGVEGDLLVFPEFKQNSTGSGTAKVQPMLNFQKVWVVDATDDGLKSFSKPETDDPDDPLEIIQATDDDPDHITTCAQGQGPVSGHPCKVWLKVNPDRNIPIGRTNSGGLKITYKPDNQNEKTKTLPAFADRYILAGGSFTGAQNVKPDGSGSVFVPNTFRLALYGPKPSDPSSIGWSSLASLGAKGVSAVHYAERQGMLYIGGQLGGANNIKQGGLNNVARFDGGGWYPLAVDSSDSSENGIGDKSSQVNDINVLFDRDKSIYNIFVTGLFDRAGTQNNVNNIAYWHVNTNDRTAPDKGEWNFMGQEQGSPGIQSGPGFTMLPDTKNNSMLVGGQFGQAGSNRGFNGVATGSFANNGLWQWQKTASGTKSGLSKQDFDDPRIEASTAFKDSDDNKLSVIGGNFTVGDNDDFGIAQANLSKSSPRWEKVTNSPIKRDNENSAVQIMQNVAVTEPNTNATLKALFVGGQFVTDKKGQNLLAYIPTQTSWVDVGSPEMASSSDKSAFVDAMTTYKVKMNNETDTCLAVGGQFDDIGNKQQVNNVVKVCSSDLLNSQTWQKMSEGVVGGVVNSLDEISEVHMGEIAS